MEVVLTHANEEPSESNLLRSVATQVALAIDRVRSDEERRLVSILEETDRLKSSLLSAVSHDLRTPLASIKASVTSLMLSDPDWSTEERMEMLEAIDAETDRLDRLVGNVLDVSRIESGALRPLRDWYDLDEVLNGAVAEATRNGTGHPVSVSVSGRSSLVQIDLVLVRQALVNLLENAAKHSPPGTPISIHAETGDDMLVFEVSDRGAGVPFDQRERIFRPFVRSREHGDREHGVGLGLAICRGIAEAHGGQIALRDTSGGGATFVLSLPQPMSPVLASP